MEKLIPEIERNPEDFLNNLDNQPPNEVKYADACEAIGKDPEMLNQICNQLNYNLTAGLADAGINFPKIFEQHTGTKLEVV